MRACVWAGRYAPEHTPGNRTPVLARSLALRRYDGLLAKLPLFGKKAQQGATSGAKPWLAW